MAEVVGILRALLTLDSAQFESGIRRSEKELKTFATSSQRIGRQASALGGTLTRGLTLPLVALGGAAGKAAIDFESSFAGVRKTVNATEPEFAALAQGFRDLAQTIPINVNELNRIGEAAGQLGVQTDEILGFTDVMAKLGVTTNLSADQAATSLARFANIINNEAGPQFDRLGSTVVDLGNNFATTELEIVEFGLRIAGAGKQIGLTEPEILAIGTALSSVGVQAEAGGTAIARVMVDIDKAVSLGGEKLELFALVADTTSEKFATAWEENTAEALLAVVEGLGTVEERGGDLNLVLDDLGLDSARVALALKNLAGAGELTGEAIRIANGAWRENTALTIEAQKRFETTASQLTLLWGRIRDVGITLGNALLPAIRSLIGFMDVLIPAIDALGKGFATLPGPVQATFLGLAAIGAAIGPMLLAFGGLASASGNVALMFTRQGLAARVMSTSMQMATGPSTRLGMALAMAGKATALFGAAVAGWSLGSAIRNLRVLGTAGATVGEVFDAGAVKVFNWIRGVKASNQDIVDAIRSRRQLEEAQGDLNESTDESTEISRQLDAVLDDLGRSFEEIGAGVDETSASIGAFATELDGWIEKGHSLTIVNDDVQRSAEAIGRSFDAMASSGSVLTSEILLLDSRSLDLVITLGDVGRAAAAAGQGFDDLADDAEESGNTIAAAFKRTLGDLNRVFQSAFEGGGGLGGAISSLATNLTEGLLAFIPGIGPVIAQFGGAIVSGVKALFGKLFGGPSEAELQAREIVSAFTSEIVDGLTDGQIAEAQQALAAGWEDVNDAALAIGIRDMFVEAGLSAEEGLAATQALWDAIKDGGPEAVEAAIANIRLVSDEVDRLQALREGDIEALRASRAETVKLFEETQSNFDAMEAAANKYGISLHALGPQFKAAKIDEIATGLVKDFELLTKGGANVNVVLRGMADEAQGVIREAEKFGTAIPESMRPMLQKMVEQGLLTDANGKKLRDLSGINFHQGPTQGFEKIIDKIDKMIDRIAGRGGLVDSILDIPDRTVKIRFDVRKPKIDVPGELTVSPMARGGFGQVTRPTLFLAGEAGPEQFAFSGANRDFTQVPVGGGGGDVRGVEHRLDRLHEDQQGLNDKFDLLPEMLTMSLRAALRGVT